VPAADTIAHAAQVVGRRKTEIGPSGDLATEINLSDSAEISRLNRKYPAATRHSGGAGGGRRPSQGGGLRALGRMLVPVEQRHREVAAIMVMVVAAGALSAGLPGVWAARPESSPSEVVEAYLDTAARTSQSPSAQPTDSPTLEPSPADSPPPADSPSPAPTPTPAPVKAQAKASAMPKTSKVYQFVALGDSLTAWPTDGPWPSRLDALDGHLTLAHNSGIPGDTTAGMLSRLNRDVFAYDPGVLFIMGGTNDLGRKISNSTTISNLKAIVVAARARGIKVFLMEIPPDSYAGEAAAVDSLNAQIVHLANMYQIVAIDIHTPLSTSGGVYQSKFTTDGVHFTDLGAQTVANTIYGRIKGSGY
jgi:lysophospholipase L1-like esterase